MIHRCIHNKREEFHAPVQIAAERGVVTSVPGSRSRGGWRLAG
jgi:hypothetical protein